LYGGNSARRVSNEEEVEQLFIRHGFQIVYPEKLNFDEQVKLIANTSVLAGFEGSAMHLSGFLPEGATTLLICKHPEPSNQNAFNKLSNSSLILIQRKKYVLRKGKRKFHFNKERFRFEKAKRGIVFDIKKLDSLLSEQNFF
jgi:capsular polysaccharide biosynthesis protein